MSRSLGIAFRAVIVSALLAATAAAQAPLYGGTLRLGYNSDVGSFNPMIHFSFSNAAVHNQIFNRLLTFDEDWQIIGDLAERWEVSGDGRIHTFHLWDGVVWHDGTPFTSADVHYTYDLVTQREPGLSGPVPLTSFLVNLETIETPDNRTIVFTYDRPTPLYHYALGQSYTNILPRHIYQGTSHDANPANTQPIGTGPFKFVEHVRGSHVTLEANTDYFKGRPYLDGIQFRITPSFDAAFVALEAGELDAIDEQMADSASSMLDDLRGRDDLHVDNWSYWTVWRLAFNFAPEAVAAHPWIADKRVREAIAYAIDRETLLDVAFDGAANHTWGPVSSTISEYYVGDELDTFAYDPIRAIELLEEAGYPPDARGNRLRAQILVPIVGRDVIGEIIREMLGAVGIDIELRLMDRGAWISQVLYGGAGDVAMSIGSGGTGPDPAFGRIYYHGDEVPGTGGANFVYYRSTLADDLFDAADTASDPAERRRLFGEWQAQVVDDLPAVWLYDAFRIEIWSDEFAGFETTRPLKQFADMSQIYWMRGRAAP